MRVLLLLFVFCCVLNGKSAQAETPIPYFSGIPVMSGFEIIPDSILVFDKPQGQIAQVSLICDHACPTLKAVQSYYDGVLGALGWGRTKISPYVYRKNSHQIRYDYVGAQQGETGHILTFYAE